MDVPNISNKWDTCGMRGTEGDKWILSWMPYWSMYLQLVIRDTIL